MVSIKYFNFEVVFLDTGGFCEATQLFLLVFLLLEADVSQLFTSSLACWATHQRLHFAAAARTLLLLNAKSRSILLKIRQKASKVAKIDIFYMIMFKILF